MLRDQFQRDQMLIGPSDGQTTKMRIAQGVGSDRLKFSSVLCAECNGTKTQPADLEFDIFLERVRQTENDVCRTLAEQRYAVGSKPYLNVFRYFAKQLCCHLSDAGAPVFLRLSRFAIGATNNNCVCLRSVPDDQFRDLQSQGITKYAAQGGLAIACDNHHGAPTRVVSSLSTGPIRFEFFFALSIAEQFEIHLSHRDFIEKCHTAIASTETR